MNNTVLLQVFLDLSLGGCMHIIPLGTELGVELRSHRTCMCSALANAIDFPAGFAF